MSHVRYHLRNIHGGITSTGYVRLKVHPKMQSGCQTQTITYVSNVFITEETAFLWTCYTMLLIRVRFASCFSESATRAQLCCQRPCPAPAMQKQTKARFGPQLTRKYTQKTHKLTIQVQQKRGQYALKNNPS